jgi:hypothetical protein
VHLAVTLTISKKFTIFNTHDATMAAIMLKTAAPLKRLKGFA